MSTLCVIPARGGSKRIPRKNVKPFAGAPMIVHSVRAALRSEIFDRVVVSTDDAEIAEVARAHGAEIPFMRPPELADDMATTDAVYLHAIGAMEAQAGPFEHACCLYATAPFVRPEDLRAGLDALRTNRATSAFSMVRFDYPIFRALKINDRGRVEMFWPEHRLTRSQDLPAAWHDAGQFYWVDVAKYKREGRIFSSDAVPVPLPPWRVQDIDTPEDWTRAELMFKALDSGTA